MNNILKLLMVIEKKFIAQIENNLINFSENRHISKYIAYQYYKLRHMLLYIAIRKGLIWIPDGCKILLSLCLNKGDTLIDIGANVGRITQQGAWLVGNNGQVHSFEPSPTIALLLSNRVKQLDLKNVKINIIGLGRKSENAILYEYSEKFGGSSSLRPNSCTDFHHSFETQIKVGTLNDYIRNNHIENVKLIKIDVEGSEIDVLHGGSNFIKANHPILYIEASKETQKAFGYDLNTLIYTIKKFGYQIFSWRSDGIIEIFSDKDIPDNWKFDNFICFDIHRNRKLYNQLFLASSFSKRKINISLRS